jgi:hypothetical protein
MLADFQHPSRFAPHLGRLGDFVNRRLATQLLLQVLLMVSSLS